MAPANLTRRRMIAIAAATAGSAFLSGGRTRLGGRCRALARIGARRAGVDRHLSIPIGRRPKGSSRFAWRRCGGWSGSSACTGRTPRSAPSTAAASWSLRTPTWSRCSRPRCSFAELTDGAFDPTVQPLWQLYAGHFSSERPDPDGPPAERLAEALAKVGRSGLRVSEERVALLRRGAAITLNGIAQGYATDRVVGCLARTRAVDDPRQHGRDTRARSESRRHAVARRPCRSGRTRRAHRNRRPGRSRGRDHGGRGLPLRSFRAASRICSIPRRDAVPRSIGRSASSRRPPPRRMRFRPPSA